MEAKGFGAQRLELEQAFGQLLTGEAVLGLAGIAHNGGADSEIAAGVEAAAHALRHAAVLIQHRHMAHVVQIDERAQAAGVSEFLRGHIIGGEHDLMALKAQGLGQHQFCFAGAVHAAALFLEDAQNGRVGQRFDGKVLLVIRAPGKGLIHGLSGAADACFVI